MGNNRQTNYSKQKRDSSTGTQLGGREGDGGKSFDFGKEGTDFVHLSVYSSIQGVVLTVSGRKNSQIYSCGTIFYYAF